MQARILYKIFVSGRVQGVGFRHETKIMARFLGLKGFVKNLADGRVYIEAEGDTPALGRFIEWCRKGPGYGNVEKVEKTEAEARGYTGFDIRY